jgi:mannopine transport system substrate-binding protein
VSSSLLKYVGIAFAALGVLSLDLKSIGAQDPLESEMVIRTSGGIQEKILKDLFLDPFTAATGVKVITVPVSYGEQLAKMKAMKEAGKVEWDIVNLQYDQVPTLAEYLEDNGDCSSLPNVAAQGIRGTCARYGILSAVAARIFAYNPNAFPGPKPQTWADFFDTRKFPQRRAMPNDGTMWADLAAALLADGVAPDKLFPLDLDRAFRKMDEIRPTVAAWWKTGDQSMQLIKDGEADMAIMFGSRGFAMRDQNLPIAWTFDQAIADSSTYSILQGAPHPKAAAAFLNFYMTRPEAHATMTLRQGFGTPNRFAAPLLPADLRENSLANPKISEQLVHMDMKWVAENRGKLAERWNKWLAQ